MEVGDELGAKKILLQTLQMDPFMIPALQMISRIHLRRGETDQAVGYMQRAVEIDRQSTIAHADLAMALIADKQFTAACKAFDRALQLAPDNILVANNYAWLLATGPAEVLNGDRAVQLATHVCETTQFKTPEFLDTLAAAHAESGDLDLAIDFTRQAMQLHEDMGRHEAVNSLRARLDLYRSGLEYRDPEMQLE